MTPKLAQYYLKASREGRGPPGGYTVISMYLTTHEVFTFHAYSVSYLQHI